MNRNAKKFRIRPCEVCGYPFSDRHHYYPKAQLDPHYNRATILLCPNHHRYANMIQTMLESKQPRDIIQTVAERHFDADFNTKVLNLLIEQYYALEQRHNDLITTAIEFMLDAIEQGTRGRNDNRNS